MTPATTTTSRAGEFERSRAQRLDALERANDVRTKRAALKRDLKAGRGPTIHGLLMAPPAYIWTAKVFDMLLATPKYGRVKANKVLTQCRISPSKTVGGLSQRQRDEVVSLLRAPGRAVVEAQRSRCVHARGPDGTRSVCGTRAARPRLTGDLSKITCLTCANLTRLEMRRA